MSRNKQIWHLDLNEVERIKAGVLRYISVSQTSRSKDKYLHTPSTPLTPKKSGRSRVDKSRREENQFALSFKLDSKSRQHQGIEMPKHDWSIPKGYYLGEDKKIYAITDINIQKNEDLPEVMAQQCIQHQIKITNQQNIKFSEINDNQKDEIKQQQNETQLVFTPQLQQKKPQATQSLNQQSLIIKPQKQQKLTFSVSELAKRFGGLKKQQSEQVSNWNKTVISSEPTAKFNFKPRQNYKITSESLDDEQKSTTSFGKVDHQVKPHRKISDFLNTRMEEKKKEEKQRKRSQTYQDNVDFEIYNNVIKQQNDQRLFQRTRQSENIIVTKPQRELADAKFRSVQFTQSQEKELKIKYNVLSLKLDALKNKVLEECADTKVIQKKHISVSPSSKKRMIVGLYNKHSPLKNLQRKRESLIKVKRMMEVQSDNTKICLQSILRL